MKKRIWIFTILIFILLFTTSCGINKKETPVGENLLVNGDFTTDVWDAWEKDIWIDDDWVTQIELTQDNGENAIMIMSNDYNDAKITQRVKVDGNSYYKLSGYIKTENVRDGAGANLSFENIFSYAGSLLGSNDEYQYVEMYGKTAKKQNSLNVFVRLGGYSRESVGTAYFKDIRLERVDDVPSDVRVEQLEEVKVVQKKEKEENPNKKKFDGWMLVISLFYILGILIYKRQVSSSGLSDTDDKTLYKNLLIISLLAGTIIRIALAAGISGYPNDIACWMGWARISAENGLVNLYDGSVFIDYPPGYMYILYVLGMLMKIPFIDDIAQVVVKIPSIITDVVLAVVIFNIASKSFDKRMSLMLSVIYFFSPAVITDSAAWGQIDSILALMVVLYILRLYKYDFVLAGIILAVGTLLKPQMLLFAPVYLVAAFYYGREKGYKEGVKKFFYGFVAGCGAFFLIVLPFQIRYGFSFIFNLYMETLSSYTTMSLNACNVWGLIGGMWTDVGEMFGPFTFAQWGNIGLVVAVVTYLVISFFDKDKKNIFYNAAVLIIGIYMLAGKMHERYMFAAMALLIVSYIFTKKRSHFMLFVLFSITQFANISLVLANEYIFDGDFWTILISLVTIFGYISLLMVSLFNIYGIEEEEKNIVRKVDVEKNKKTKDKIAASLNEEKYQGLFKRLTKKDYIIMGIVIIVYTIVAFINLGNTDSPETMWVAGDTTQEVIVDFGEDVDIEKAMFFRVLATHGAYFSVEYASEDNKDDFYLENFYVIGEQEEYNDEDGLKKRQRMESEYQLSDDFGSVQSIIYANSHEVLKWKGLECNTTARYARIKLGRSTIRIAEMGFYDTDRNLIPIEKIQLINCSETDENSPTLMFDEQDTVTYMETYMNSTYFDEIYHARTAWEHLEYIEPYETTHPPLGKVIMSLGIKWFGLNPFGWRFMGTIMGILMIPAMYLLGFALFEKTRYAAITMILMTFDFMHFTQTRIATIDSYGVLFIILMYLCMAIYYKMNFYKHKFVHTLIPLGLSGLFFGLGAASKWICIYSGAGLAVIFFSTLFTRLREYSYAKNSDDSVISDEMREKIKSKFIKYTVITLLLCILFFIIVPCVVYYFSYTPIMQIEEGRGVEFVWQCQVNMYNYHTQLSDNHGFASPWYEWPLIIKPIWFYSGFTVKQGYVSTIASFGNPAVWWIGTCAIIYVLIYMAVTRKTSKTVMFILIGFASQYLPWVLVPRSMFIYHYFASIPFVILLIVVLIKKIEELKWYKKQYTYIYLGIVVVLFIIFYPALSGMTISSSYAHFLKWLPTWWFVP